MDELNDRKPVITRLFANVALLALLGAMLTACGGTSKDIGPVDRGGSGDGGATTDGGTTYDGGTTTDGGTTYDGGTPDGGSSHGPQLIQLIDDWTIGTTLATDSSGTLHVATSAQVNDHYKVIYAKCAGQCSQDQSWSAVAFPIDSEISHVPTVALTRAGKPRILYATSQQGAQGFHYLECNSACDGAANWKDVRLTNEDPPTTIAPRPRVPFAVSPGGRAAFLYGDNFNMFAWICSANCGNPSSWHRVTLAGLYTYPESVAFGADQSLQIVARERIRDEESLYWFDCNGDCFSTADWFRMQLRRSTGAIEAAIARTSQGGTRVLVYADPPDRPMSGRVFTYLACDAQCRQSGSWTPPLLLPLAPRSGDIGFDFVLDSADKPIVGYLDDGETGFASCSANCSSSAGGWQRETSVEVEDLNQQFPPLVPASCIRASWSMYTGPSVAPRTGNKPFMAVTAGARAYGGQCGTGSSHTKTRTFLTLPR